MYFSEQGNVDDDATFITIFLVSFYLQSCCLMQSVVCSLRSAVSSLQSANVTHRKKKTGGLASCCLAGVFLSKIGDRGHFVRTQCMDQHMMFYCPRETGHYCLRLLSCNFHALLLVTGATGVCFDGER